MQRMRVHILYFAAIKERLRRDGDVIELPAGADVANALAQLAAAEPQLARMLPACRVAVNREFVDAAAKLADGDELALIPPVAGGTGEVASPHHVALCRAPLSVDRCVQAVAAAGAGATVVFIGHVRDQNRGNRIVALDYSAYEPMALEVMRRLCDAVAMTSPNLRLAVEHRVGSLVIGDLAVVIAASAPHRAEAFAACRELIERLKQDVPIWKKEFGEAGEEWLGMGP